MPLLSRETQSNKRAGFRTLSCVLNKRCSIQVLEHTATESDGFGAYTSAPIQQTYKTILSIWCGVMKSTSSDFIRAIRGVNASDEITHYVWIRHESVKAIGNEFSSGFSNGMKTMADINPIKAEHFVLLETAVSGRGRRLKIVATSFDEVNREYVVLKCVEQKEVGTGYAN